MTVQRHWMTTMLNSAEQWEKGESSVFTYYRCYEQGSEDKERREGQRWRSWRCWVCTCEQSHLMHYCSMPWNGPSLFNEWSEFCFISNLNPLNGFQLKIPTALMTVLEQVQEGKEALVVCSSFSFSPFKTLTQQATAYRPGSIQQSSMGRRQTG